MWDDRDEADKVAVGGGIVEHRQVVAFLIL